MTSRAPASTPRAALRGAYRTLTRALALRHGLVGGAACVALLAIAVAAGAGVPIGAGAAWVRLAALLVLCIVAVAWALRAFLADRPAFDRYLEHVERRFPDVRSWLRNALELEAAPAPHTSAELARALHAEAARRLDRVPLAELQPRLEPRRPALTLAFALGGIVALALIAPERTARSWHTLLDPSSAAPPVRLEVEPGSTRVSPGGSLSVRARVWGTRHRPRLQRDGGPRVDAVADGDDAGAHVWHFDLVQLTRAERYRVRVANVASPRYAISLSGDPQPVSFDIRYHSPGYARLPDQRGVTTRGDLSALAGTRATLEVTFDRDLDQVSATLPGGRATRWTALSPRRWRGDVPIAGDGDWTLAAHAPEGAASFRYHVTALPDAPPVLAVRLPEGSLDLPNGQQVALDVMGQDDLGLTQLTLEWRKRPEQPWSVLPLARFAGEPRDAHVTKTWDASGIALLPGETAAFRFALWDNDGLGRQVARSATYELRFPSLAQLYEHVDQQQAGAQQSFEKVTEQVKELQQSLDKLSRQAPSPTSSQPQSFERKEEMQQALDRQQNLSKQIDQAAQQLRESLADAAERRAFDEQLTRKLQEMAQLLDQIQSKEFKDALQKMQQALQQLDRQQADQGLQQMRQQNQELMKNLERTVELLKQLREEEQLQALAQRAQELKNQQDQLNTSSASAPPKSDPAQAKAQAQQQAQQQQQAKSQSEQLAKDARQTSQESQQQDTQQQLQKAAEELEQQASPAQQQAAHEMQQQNQSAAQKMGQKASDSLQRAAQQLAQLAQQHQQAKDQVDLAAVRRAAQDLVSLQRQAEQNMSSESPQEERGDRQTDLSEGTARVADSLYQLARRQPFISPKLSESLGQAIQQLSSSGREMADGNRARAESQGRSASEALNAAVLELRQSENSMCNKPGTGNKPGQQGQGNLPMQMTQLGEQQGQLNQDSRNLSQRLSQQMRLSAGDQEQVRRMADEQARIRSQLAEIQREDEQKKQLLGRLGDTQQEMQEVEEALRRGDTGGDVEQKQQHILSRLLDASRSVNRRDFDPERESRPGVDVARPSPAELPADLLRAHDRLQVDLLKAQADRYPAQYRTFIERYLESLNRSPR